MKRPYLVAASTPARVRAVVLISHGGQQFGTKPPHRFTPGLLRMIPIARALSGRGTASGLLVTHLRYRVVGYNDGSPVEDVQWAISQLASHDAPICLVGHSMGARASLQAAGSAHVVGVVALAPWCPPSDPVDQLADRAVVFIHGVDDRVTSPASSYEYALRTRAVTERACRFVIARSGHGMVRRARLWHRLTTSFVLGAVGLEAMPRVLTSAMQLPAEEACAIAR
jgi:hypothetical protein